MDKHVRRSGEDYAQALLTLLPRGQAWPRHPFSTLVLAITGLAEYWGFVDSRAADLLERESDPRLTVELLPDWERNWGLPDPCIDNPATDLDSRHQALVEKMTLLGAQSREFFINLAAKHGYTITITEYRPFVCGLDRCGDNRVYGDGSNPMLNQWNQPIKNPHGDPVALGELSEWPNYGCGGACRFYWTVHVGHVKLVWFRVTSGQCGVDPHLRIFEPQELECLLDRVKPAHTQIVWDFSGSTSGSDPMAGTP
jgi:uncharacterized protein YmfQ (DUF2313 family)